MARDLEYDNPALAIQANNTRVKALTEYVKFTGLCPSGIAKNGNGIPLHQLAHSQQNSLPGGDTNQSDSTTNSYSDSYNHNAFDITALIAQVSEPTDADAD